jgi:hypothetical protein
VNTVGCVLEYRCCELYSYLVVRGEVPVSVIVRSWYYKCLCLCFYCSGVCGVLQLCGVVCMSLVDAVIIYDTEYRTFKVDQHFINLFCCVQ